MGVSSCPLISSSTKCQIFRSQFFAVAQICLSLVLLYPFSAWIFDSDHTHACNENMTPVTASSRAFKRDVLISAQCQSFGSPCQSAGKTPTTQQPYVRAHQFSLRARHRPHLGKPLVSFDSPVSRNCRSSDRRSRSNTAGTSASDWSFDMINCKEESMRERGTTPNNIKNNTTTPRQQQQTKQQLLLQQQRQSPRQQQQQEHQEHNNSFSCCCCCCCCCSCS